MAYLGVSKSSLLEWINNYFDINYTKIEQCGNGAVYCMIFNALYPNTINIARVNKSPSSEFETLTNYKLLQHGFNKVKISREVNVEKLMKCRLQDNLEFLQWFGKLWCEHNKDFVFSGSTSRPGSRRTSSIGLSRNSNAKPSGSRVSSNATPKQRSPTDGARSNIRSNSYPAQANHSNNENDVITNSTNKTNNRNHVVNGDSKLSNEISKLRQELQTANEALEEVSNLKECLQIERNFYFGKLREIEVICQNISQTNNAEQISTLTLIEDLKEIMYSTEEGFLLPDDENETPDLDDSNGNIENEITPTVLHADIETKNEIKSPQTDYKHVIQNHSLNESNHLDLDNTVSTVNVTNEELFDDETF